MDTRPPARGGETAFSPERKSHPAMRKEGVRGGTLGSPALIERVRAFVAAVPIWAWLGALVALSALVRFLLARSSPAPWIFVDELIYSELAKSFADGDGLAIRDVASGAYGFVYPVLISPAWAVFENVPHAYAAAKAINALVMSSAAIPAYLLARRLIGQTSSFAVAVLAVAVPSLAYTGTIMTENAFYPAFLFAILGIVRALERPTVPRQLWALALIGFAFVTRVQALALAAALVSAIVILTLVDALEERPRLVAFLRRLDRFRVTWIVLGGGALLLVVVQAGRGRSLGDVLGAYQAAAGNYRLEEVPRWFLYHVAELDLYLGVIPFAAFLLLAAWALRPGSARAARIFAAASVPAVFWLALLVATFATQPSVARIQERNLFYVAPLFFAALLVWVERGLPRGPGLVAAGAVAAALPGMIPFGRFINTSAVSDTFALLPLWNLQDSVISGSQVRPLVITVAVAAAALFVFLPRRLVVATPALVLLYFAVSHYAVGQRIEQASAGGLFAGIQAEREWVDESVGADAEVTAIWSGNANERVVWLNEFFNRSVRKVYALGQPLPGTLPEGTASVDAATGLLTEADGRPVEAEYALSDGSVVLDGEPVAYDPGVGMTLYRVGGPLSSTTRVSGLYTDFAWSGPEVTYTKLACSGGTLTVGLLSDRGLFDRPQTVTALVGGREAVSLRLRPGQRGTLRVPLRTRGDTCEATFTVTPTAVPDEVVGNGDTRELGVHFTSLRYQP